MYSVQRHTAHQQPCQRTVPVESALQWNWRCDNDSDNDTLKEVRPTIVRGLALQA